MSFETIMGSDNRSDREGHTYWLQLCLELIFCLSKGSI